MPSRGSAAHAEIKRLDPTLQLGHVTDYRHRARDDDFPARLDSPRARARVRVDAEDVDSAALDAVVFTVIGAAFTTTARPRARAPRRDARRDPITIPRAGALAGARRRHREHRADVRRDSL